MKPTWLLLAVSLILLLVLAPATALSQGPTVEAGCGSATINGRMAPGEWADATRVPWFAPAVSQAAYSSSLHPEEDASASQDTLTGWLYLMNDQNNLYLGAQANLDNITIDPNWWFAGMGFGFTDEGDAVDGAWNGIDCTVPPGEGLYWAGENSIAGPVPSEFARYSGAGLCTIEFWPPGIAFDAAPGSMVWELAVDLVASELNKADGGDCFRFASSIDMLGCVEGSGCGAPPTGNWRGGAGYWPEGWSATDPSTFGTLCLNPCAVEFVPEPGTIMLLGSGLAGLAGYATLRLRSGHALRQKTRE